MATQHKNGETNRKVSVDMDETSSVSSISFELQTESVVTEWYCEIPDYPIKRKPRRKKKTEGLETSPRLEKGAIRFEAHSTADNGPEELLKFGGGRSKGKSKLQPEAVAYSSSTYPHLPGKPKREGDPIADKFSLVKLNDGAMVISLADGCNWGKKSSTAALKACKAFVAYVLDCYPRMESTSQIGHYLLRGFARAHQSIIEEFTAENVWEAGTTTLLGGILVRTYNSDDYEARHPRASSSRRSSSRSSASSSTSSSSSRRIRKNSKSPHGRHGSKSPRGNISPHSRRSSKSPRRRSSKSPHRRSSKSPHRRKSRSPRNSITQNLSMSSADAKDTIIQPETLSACSSSPTMGASCGSSEDLSTASTTTSTAGAGKRKHKRRTLRDQIRDVEEGQAPAPWAFICCSVGDCKAFTYNRKQGKAFDITGSNRFNVNDATDPGGRLGPYLDEGAPDLRNLRLYYVPCNPGDTIVVMTDGIYDNIDPQQLAINPADVGLDSLEWSVTPDSHESNCKIAYIEEWMRSSIFTDSSVEIPITDVMARLRDHCLKITKPSRDWLYENPKKRLPLDYKRFPGKVDHLTGVVCTVDRCRRTLSRHSRSSSGSSSSGSDRYADDDPNPTRLVLPDESDDDIDGGESSHPVDKEPTADNNTKELKDI